MADVEFTSGIGGEALWEECGTYQHTIIKTSGARKVSGMKFNATAQRGNTFVHDMPGN